MYRKGTIDRFEGDWAVVELEGREFVDISIDLLPPDAKEGSVILIDGDGKVIASAKETDEQRERINELMDRLFED